MEATKRSSHEIIRAGPMAAPTRFRRWRTGDHLRTAKGVPKSEGAQREGQRQLLTHINEDAAGCPHIGPSQRQMDAP